MTDTPPGKAADPLIWSKMTRKQLACARERKALVLIPTGSIEQHGDHLPVETDTLLATALAERAAQQMTMPVVVAPTVPFGFTPHHLSLTGTVSLRLQTYLAMLSDIARSILSSGFPRAIFVNGHGGNGAPLRSLVGELTTDGYPVGAVDYFAPGMGEAMPLLQGDMRRVGHACEAETALMMALSSPDGADRIAGAAATLPERLTQPWIAPGHEDDPITEADACWAAIFHADDCGYYGDPAAARRETGDALLKTMALRLAAFLDAFAKTPLRFGISRDPAHPKIAPPLE